MTENELLVKEIKAQTKRLNELAAFINLHSTEGETFARAAHHGLDALKMALADVEEEMCEYSDWWKQHDEVSAVLGRKPGEFAR